MNFLYSKPKLSVIALLVSQSVFYTSAFAAGFQINEISPSLQGDATAGAAAANNDVTSMFINPATLATLQENQGYFGANGIFPNLSVSDAHAIHTVNIPGVPVSSVTAPVQGKHHQGTISPNVFVPDGYFGYRINDKLVVGVATVSPFGLTTTYDFDSALRFAAVNSAVRTFDINPVLAYSVNDKWAVGAGFQAQYLQATFSNFNGAYTGDPTLDALNSADHPTHLQGDTWGFGYNLGVLFRPDDRTRLGIGYRSQIRENIRSGKGQQYIVPGSTVPAPSQNFPFNAETSVNTTVKTPQVLTFSAARDMAQWTVKATAQVNFWDSFKELSINMPDAFATNSTIQAHWKDAWFGALGAEYHATNQWTVRGGVAYDETPTKDKFRDPRIPDSDRVWLTAGATYVVNKHLSIDGAYEHIFFQNPTVRVTQASGSSATSTLPLEVNQVHADYKASVDIVALGIRYKV